MRNRKTVGTDENRSFKIPGCPAGSGSQGKRKCIGRLVLLVVLILAAGFVVDLFCQRQVLRLPEQEKGTHLLSFEGAEVQGYERVDDRLQISGYAGRIVIPMEGRYVSRFCLDYTYSHRVDMQWTVWLTGEEEPRYIQDGNSLFVNTTVERIDACVDAIEIYCEPEEEDHYDLFLNKAYIVNEYQVHWHRMIFVWVILALAAFLILGRRWIPAHPAESYLVAAIALGSLMIILTPANKASWDEEVHFFHSYCVSHFGFEVETNEILEKLFVADEENWPYSLPVGPEERSQMNEALNTRFEEDEYYYSRGHALAGIYTPAYVPSAVGIRLGSLLNMPFTVIYQMGRWFNLLFCAVVMAFAIRKIPVGKAILAMIGLLPTPLFLMAMYSYDSFITSLFALGFAWFLAEYMDREKTISWTAFAVIALSFSVGSLPKAIYVPLILVMFLLPSEKFRDRRQERLMKAITVVLFLALMASFVLPTVLSPAETNDLRGGNTSEAGQIPYILSDIPGFLNMLIYSIRTTFAGFTVGAAVYGSVGHLGLEMLGMVIPLFVLAVIFADEKALVATSVPAAMKKTVNDADKSGCKGLRLTWPARLWTLLLCLGIMAMAWVAMYLAFTPVGSDHINGVQARYYIPLLLPVYLCLCPDRIRVQVKKELLYPGTIAVSAAITAVVIARTMLSLCV